MVRTKERLVKEGADRALDPRATPAVEDYAKAIYRLQERDGRVSTAALAARVAVTAGSVSAMLHRMDELGYVRHVRYQGVQLTESGRRLALAVLRRHRLLELFLVRALGLSWDRVHEEAETLEHALSAELEEAIAAWLGDPVRDPHGDPIPSRDGTVVEEPTVSLASLEPGRSGELLRVSDLDPAVLRHLDRRGIALGDRVEVLRREPFGGPFVVVVEGSRGSTVHSLGPDLAATLRVRVDG
jgi:DtxR family transcriptional regulator, Mn-dependent transcriptional regulator